MIGDLDLGLVRKGRIRFVRQTEMTECGLACLVMAASHHGLELDVGGLRRQFQASMRGVTLRQLVTIADRLGLHARAVQIPPDAADELPTPTILHWDQKHYVVLEKARGGKYLVHDPANSTRWIGRAELLLHFTGFALLLEPAASFERGDRRENVRLAQLWTRMSGLRRTGAQIVLLTLLLQLFVLAAPYYMQIAVDGALPASDAGLLGVLAIGFGFVAVFSAVTELLRSMTLLSAGSMVSYGIASNVVRKLVRLPVGWFERRQVGDILSRFQSITPVRTFLTEGAVAGLLDGVLTVLTLTIMVLYSIELSVIAVAALLLLVLVKVLAYAPAKAAQDESISTAGREQSLLIETIRGIATLRLSNREASRLALWRSRYADAMNASAGTNRIAAWQSAASSLVVGVEIVVSVWLAVRLVIAGGFTLGMVFAFTTYKTQFIQRALSFADQFSSFRLLGLHLDRLSDIALADNDASFATENSPRTALEGSIRFDSVGYRYSMTDPPVLSDVSFAVRPGEHLAITGPSGGGKTTLLKIALGLVEPSSGRVLVDGRTLSEFGHKNFHDQVGAVLQDDHLFAGTISDNITLFDEEPDHEFVEECAGTAGLLDDVRRMPLGFQTLVGDMGSALSGGQRQRLLLSRALYRKPRVLVMDEGTSALDAGKEREISARISSMGITRIVVAHRVETIAAADRVLLLRDSRLDDVTDSYAELKATLNAQLAGVGA
jgi:ATP-binding cassette subfamily B protein RaxB